MFFGGGTPSLFAPDAIARILDRRRQRLAFRDGIEITMETNPGTVEHGRFDDYLRAGVKRISFGVQSFDDDKLRRLGRIHSAGEAERAIKTAQDAGYDNINLDLMYALPRANARRRARRHRARDRACTRAHLALPADAGAEHAVRREAAAAAGRRCRVGHAGGVSAARSPTAGYAQYEVSAYARDGRRCAHNLNYWTFGDYLGIGAGAHGKISERATARSSRSAKVKLPRSYLDRAARGDAFGTVDAVVTEQRAVRIHAECAAPQRRRFDCAISNAAHRPFARCDRGPLAEARERGWLEADDDARCARPRAAAAFSTT